MIVQEVEIGPHFLTIYSKQLPEMIEAAKELHKWFLTAKPELASIQQDEFVHEPNDPNVYHPFGEPNNFRTGFRHFHIRYGKEPTQADIDLIINRMKETGNDIAQDIPVTRLVDNRLPKFQDIVYPSIEGDYLEYIDTLRTGEWLNGL